MQKQTLPKLEITGTGSFTPPVSTPLTRESQIGQCVKWDSITRSYMGVLIEWDSNVAIVRLMDGAIKAVEC